LIAKIDVIGNRLGFLFQVVIRNTRPDCDELIWFWEGKWVEQDSIDHAENGAVCADTERKGQNRNRGETRCLDQHPQCVFEIAQHVPLAMLDWSATGDL
jgi:hypothetical protein